MYQHHLSDKLDFNLFGQAAEISGFFKETESKRLTQLWLEDREKAVSTLIEETEAKGPTGFRMFLNTLKCTLDMKEMDAATRECHQVLIDELSRVELLETSVSNTCMYRRLSYNCSLICILSIVGVISDLKMS